MRLTPAWRRLLLVVHLVATIGWLGADLVLLTFAVAGARGADPLTVYPAAALVGDWVVQPLAVVSLVSGLVQGLLTPWGLLRHWWVAIKLTVTLVMTVLVLVALAPGLREAAAAGAAVTGQQRTTLLFPPSLSTSLLLLSIVLSVYKPGGRTRRGRAAVRRTASPAKALETV